MEYHLIIWGPYGYINLDIVQAFKYPIKPITINPNDKLNNIKFSEIMKKQISYGNDYISSLKKNIKGDRVNIYTNDDIVILDIKENTILYNTHI
tara:strand:- start:803 stop:1084 length:282 start_codon:yes stop_codon:yes gene_type:complete